MRSHVVPNAAVDTGDAMMVRAYKTAAVMMVGQDLRTIFGGRQTMTRGEKDFCIYIR